MTVITVLAWMPFVDPLPIAGQIWWLLSIPMALGISMIHKAWRMPTLDGYAKQVTIMSLQIVGALALMAIALAILIQVALPLFPAE